MKTKLRPILIVLISIICINQTLNSQEYKKKISKISITDFKNKKCPLDENANAYYIFDHGDSYFNYADTKVRSNDAESRGKGFQLYFTRHMRIHILSNKVVDISNFEIPLYSYGDEEKITNLKATTYNLEAGKIIKTKLKQSGIIKEETNDYWNTVKFAMPQVKEGSIIDIEYTIKSDHYFNLREWHFQYSIPVMKSSYYVRIPEYFVYKHTQKGYYPIKFEKGTKPSKIVITYFEKTQSMTSNQNTYNRTIDFLENTYSFSSDNIPAFIGESFLRTSENYLSKIEFELEQTDFPNQSKYYYSTTWEKINEKLLDNDYFGRTLKRDNHLEEDAENLVNSGAQDELLIANALELIKNRIHWDGIQTKYVNNTLNSAYKDGSGNCSDINLNLVALLRMLGFDAYPLILSTQKNGYINLFHPTLSDFNYVIAIVKMKDETLLLDATESSSEINIIPKRCLNDKGRIINNTGGEWLSLMNYSKYIYASQYELVIDDNFNIHGTASLKLKDYGSYDYKKRIRREQGEESFQESLADEEFKITNMNIVGLDSNYQDLEITYDVEQEGGVEFIDDILYFSPAFDPFYEINPFKIENREYPVEFDYPYLIQQIYTFTIPEAYKATSIPKPLIVKMPDNSGKIIYQVSMVGNKINVSSVFSLKKSMFLPEEYSNLKQFFQLFIDKQEEMIVLEKIL